MNKAIGCLLFLIQGLLSGQAGLKSQIIKDIAMSQIDSLKYDSMICSLDSVTGYTVRGYFVDSVCLITTWHDESNHLRWISKENIYGERDGISAVFLEGELLYRYSLCSKGDCVEYYYDSEGKRIQVIEPIQCESSKERNCSVTKTYGEKGELVSTIIESDKKSKAYYYLDNDEMIELNFIYNHFLVDEYFLYYPDGSIKIKGRYQSVDTSKTYQEVNQLIGIGNSSEWEGLKNGTWLYYNTKGKLVRREEYELGVKISERSYWFKRD